jgi:hypothetical protein
MPRAKQPIPAPESDLGPVAVVADEFECRKRLLLDWISEGRIRGYRFGPQMVYVDRAEIRALFRQIPASGPRQRIR